MVEKRICLTPSVQGVGGMVSFRHKLVAGLEKRGVGVSYDLNDTPYQAVLVIGGTRQLGGLWRVRQRGARIVQRLDGMNWLHRLRSISKNQSVNLRYYLRAEYGNWILATVRSRLAEHIVYQSQFSRDWWERVRGLSPIPGTVVYNGVDLNVYSPMAVDERPHDHYRILMVEGSLMGGYETGLETGVRLVEHLAGAGLDRPVELMVAGRVSQELQRAWAQKTEVKINWAGLVPRDQIPNLDRSAHLLFSSDLNAACPNSVIEALACGLPVVSFDTGALPELVNLEAGCIVPYGGDPWRLDPADVPALAAAAAVILHNQAAYRAGARQRAEAVFDLDAMVKGYLRALLID